MPDSLEERLAKAIAVRESLQPLLDETEGWDDVPDDIVQAFINGTASPMQGPPIVNVPAPARRKTVTRVKRDDKGLITETIQTDEEG